MKSAPSSHTPRLGLCCQFANEPIKFRTTTATAMARLPRTEQLKKFSELCAANAAALLESLRYCSANSIGSFRIISSILPAQTHPVVGYKVETLPGADALVAAFKACGRFAREQGIRTGFHPDQFVVLNSPDPDIIRRSVADIEAQALVAEWTNADTINIHGGGAYGDKRIALENFRRGLDLLSERARARLTVENDDKIFSPADLLPVCKAERIPLVYDVHHHRCHTDGLTIEEATVAARATWHREPLFHISSPADGWDGPKPERHHDYIEICDFPGAWRDQSITIEIEAKAKELAVAKFRRDLAATTR